MKENTTSLRASHVNSGTAMARSELGRPKRRGRAFRHPKLELRRERGEITPYGGLSLAVGLVRTLQLDRALDQQLELFQVRRPYTEADHVLTHAYNLFVGGTAIEDIANLQGSEAVRRLLGAARIPDPTTAGDFLRRFQPEDLEALDRVLDQAQEEVWRRRYGRKKQALAIVDMDSHLHPVYGNQKEGADFSYKGFLAYHPLVISLAGSQECLRLINRPGNAPSAEGAAEQLAVLLPRLRSRFREVVVRGDSAFCRKDIFEVCEANGASFAIVSSEQSNFPGLAEALSERAWKRFRPCAERAHPTPPSRRRKRRRNLRRQIALRRRKRDLRLQAQWIGELPYQPTRTPSTYRLILRRQRIKETEGQGELFEFWRYRYVLTNLRDRTAEEVVDLTYQRCDQENIIEQLQNGLAGMRLPTGELRSNGAFLRCARLAYNLKSWLAQLALPLEVVRWEWKRFRQAFVYVAATVVHHARQVQVRLAVSHRYHREILSAHARLQI